MYLFIFDKVLLMKELSTIPSNKIATLSSLLMEILPRTTPDFLNQERFLAYLLTTIQFIVNNSDRIRDM